MYQPFAHGSNRGSQRPSGQVQNVPQSQQPLNYQRVYTASNQQINQNPPPPTIQQFNQQVKPSNAIFPQQQTYGNTAPSAVPLGQQNINRQSQQAYYPQQSQQQQVPPQRYSQYSQQSKQPQQYRIVNGSQYSSTSSQSQPQQQQQVYQKPGQQYYQASTPQNYSSVPSTQSSKSATMYQPTNDRRTVIQQVQQQKSHTNLPQAPPTQQQYLPSHVQGIQQNVGVQDQQLKRLHTGIQALQIQLQTLTSTYQQNIQLKKMTVDELNLQKSQFRMQLENIYNQCRKISSEFPTILCLVTRLPSGDIGIRRTNGANSTEKEINHMISLIEETYLQFVPNRQVQQSLIPVTIQHEQVVRSGPSAGGVRDSTMSTHANLAMKKSTENLKTIIEESREKPLQDKENSNYYSPIVRAYARGRDQVQTNNVNVEDDQENIHQYGSTHKERMNTSPDVIQTTDRGQVERISYRLINPPANAVTNSRNPFATQQNFQRQFTFNGGQPNPQGRLDGSNLVQVRDHFVTQPDVLPYEPMFKDLYDETEKERVKRSSAQSVVNNLPSANPAHYSPMIVRDPSQQRLSTVPKQVVVVDQFKQAQDFNKMLKDTNQFNLQTTSKELQQLMDDQKYEQVSEYAYSTLTMIDRQVINMKATVEQALEQTELTMTKNLLLEIIESLRQTVKSKEMDISHRVISKIQKNTARLLKDKTASYSLYLYLQKITNFLKERENILNQSIQANEMSLLNQTDHSFWFNNQIDNNDPKQIIPIIENAKKNNGVETGTSLNFQFFLRDLNLPTYVPMKEQIRMQDEVRQSIQQGVGSSTYDSKVRASFAPMQSSSSQTNIGFSSAQKPIQFQNQLTESTTSASIVGKRFGVINPPEYVPLSRCVSVERPKSAQNANILGYRSPVNNVNPSNDIFNSNVSIQNFINPTKETVPTRENKFQTEEELVKRSSTIPARIFTSIPTQEDQVKKSSPSKTIPTYEGKPLNEEFAHQRKVIKTQFSTSPNKTVPVVRQEERNVENLNVANTPSQTEKKFIQIQKIAGSNSGSGVKIVSANNNNYAISHLMTPAGSQAQKVSNNGSFSATNQNNNTSNLDNILNKYRIGDIEKEIQQQQSLNNQVAHTQVSSNLGKNMEVSNNEAIIYSQVEGFAKRDDEVVKRSAPSTPVNVHPATVVYQENIENNPDLSVGQKKQVNLQYETILEKYIPNNSEKSLVMKYSQPQTARPALEQVNNQILSKNYSTQNILKAPQLINNNDPLQSVSDKYSIVINQQQESLQRTSLNFNTQQQQKKFYDLALKVKSEFPKTHKANTVLVNQMWEVAQNINESEWQNYILQQCNSAK